MWSLDVFGEDLAHAWNTQVREYGACIRVVARGDGGNHHPRSNIISSNYGAEFSDLQDRSLHMYECDRNPHPVLFHIPPGLYTLEIWLVDRSSPSQRYSRRLLTETASVPFEMRSMDDHSRLIADRITRWICQWQ